MVPDSLSFTGKHHLLSVACILAFAAAFPHAIYAVDSCSSTAFKVASTITLEAQPLAIAEGDFNGDGRMDLVATPNTISREVVVLLGRGGTERFGPPANFPAGGDARTVAVGDLNGDGKPDIIVTLDSFFEPLGRFSILLNDGTGKFGPPGIINTQGFPAQPVLADVNNDGKLDIVAGVFDGTSDGRVAVLLGNGAGGFSQAANSPFTTFSSNSAAVVVGDFNEDGKRDLAVPGALTGVQILLGDGAGGFSAGSNVVTNNSPLWLTVGDFNADGHLDLLANNQIVLGTGTGSFSSPTVVDLPVNNIFSIAGHLNSDAHLDVVSSGDTGVTIMLGDGTGNLIRGKSYPSGVAVLGSPAVLADFNEDGKTDIAGLQRTGIGILDGDGTGAFDDALSYLTSEPLMANHVVADFNNDGKQDFAVIGPDFRGSLNSSASRVEVALGDGSGNFTRKSLTDFGESLLLMLTTADFNNDGKLDLALARDGGITTLINDGTGGFPVDGLSAPNIPVPTSALKAADFNNDSKADLVAITPNSTSYVVFLGAGNGTFTNIGGGSIQAGPSFNDELDIGDLNGDSRLDVAIVRTSANVVHVLHGDGTGHFPTDTTVPIPGTPVSVVVKDLNSDGKPDLAVSNSILDNLISNSFITVLINNGAGFNAGTNYPTNRPGMLASGDFNDDNKPDLAASSDALFFGGGLDGVSVLTNKGNGEFNAAVDWSTGTFSSQFSVADFNNDGKDDLAVSQLLGSIVVLFNNFTSSQPCLSIDDVSVTETDTGTINANFTIKLSAPSAQTVRINYFAAPAFLPSIVSGATKGSDFENVPGTLTFLPGVTAQVITIPVKGDLLDEIDQFFHVFLTTPINALISDGKGVGTIVDNDAPPAITISDTTVVEGTSFQDQTLAVFNVTLNAPSEKPVSAQFTLQAGTASSGVDYFEFPTFVDFAPGSVSTTISVPIVRDNIFEPDETFFVNLSNPTNATIADGQAQGTITNDDPQPTISIAETSFAVEGAAGTTVNTQFDVLLSNPSSQTITVSFTTVDGTTTAGTDYVATSGTLTIPAGDISKTISVQVNGDNVDEIDETYFVRLSNPTNATIGRAQSIGTIQDDDGPVLSIGNVSVVEGNSGFVSAVFTVTLSAPSPQNIFTLYTTSGGTATSGVDFQTVFSNPLFIPAGATSGTVSVRIFPDLQIEPDETFTVTLTNVTNATVDPAQLGSATGTILNDDSNGKFQFVVPAFSVSEDIGSILFLVNRVDGATGTTTVQFATSDGTATPGQDYTAVSGTLTFLQGEASKTISIPIVNDNLLESGETVNITLSNPTGGATLGTPSTSVMTINSPPLILIRDESGPGLFQAAALDSLMLMRDPFPVIQALDFLNPGPDRNTRVIVFVANLQLAPGDVASIVKVNLLDSNGQSHNVDAEDVRLASVPDFMQVTFRLPSNLPAGVSIVKVRSRDQESNGANIRIK